MGILTKWLLNIIYKPKEHLSTYAWIQWRLNLLFPVSLSHCLSLFSSPTVPEPSSAGKPLGKHPEGDSPQENPSKPPLVKMIGGSSSASWTQCCSLALLFAGLCLQWILFWCQHRLRINLHLCPFRNLHAQENSYTYHRYNSYCYPQPT